MADALLQALAMPMLYCLIQNAGVMMIEQVSRHSHLDSWTVCSLPSLLDTHKHHPAVQLLYCGQDLQHADS